MGFNAEIFVFDDVAYSEQVVPALNNYVFDGTASEWLEVVLEKLRASSACLEPSTECRIRSLGFRFEQVCHYLEPDFSFAGSADDWELGWESRACASATCTARNACPLYRSHPTEKAEEFHRVFSESVIDRCLGGCQFVGRTFFPSSYTQTLENAGFPEDHAVFGLFTQLGMRGYVVGFGWGLGEGIQGWLTAGETRQLQEHLSAMDLPVFEPTFEAMRAFERGGRYDPPPPYSFEDLSLAFVRTVAAMAVSENRGVLWGNDVCSCWDDNWAL